MSHIHDWAIERGYDVHAADLMDVLVGGDLIRERAVRNLVMQAEIKTKLETLRRLQANDSIMREARELMRSIGVLA